MAKRKHTKANNPMNFWEGKRVLEIGAGPKPQANLFFPGATVETMDADAQYKPTYLNDAETIPQELYGKFDVVFASHVLEHFPWMYSANVLREWAKVVPVGGQVWVIVPSLEWAAEEVLSEEPSPAIYGHLYAGCTTEWDVHKAGFTMRRLRALFESARLGVFQAYSMAYNIQILGNVMAAQQHVVAGVRGE